MMPDLQSSLFACDVCNWSFLTTQESPGICPHCYAGKLEKVINEKLGELLQPPELLLPRKIKDDEVVMLLQKFVTGFLFTPADLTSNNLRTRARILYYPKWLVDVDVQTIWKAEVGFDYSVLSHRDEYDENKAGWSTREVTEDRIRWEVRTGKLNRTYTNIRAPAMDEQVGLDRRLGNYDLDKALPYDPPIIGDGFICIPNRSLEDAWQDAVPAIQSAAALECQQAAGANHIRGFQWDPVYLNQNWTMLLLPFISTYYLDDDSIPQGVIINARTGSLSGQKKASMKRAKCAAWWILGGGVLVFLLSVFFLLGSLISPPLAVVGGIGLFVTIVICTFALVPPAIVWKTNRHLQRTVP
jgi:hypothetical protein